MVADLDLSPWGDLFVSADSVAVHKDAVSRTRVLYPHGPVVENDACVVARHFGVVQEQLVVGISADADSLRVDLKLGPLSRSCCDYKKRIGHVISTTAYSTAPVAAEVSTLMESVRFRPSITMVSEP